MKRSLAVLLIVGSLAACANTKSNVSKQYAANKTHQLSIAIEKDSNVSIPENQYQLLESQIGHGLSKSGLLATDEERSQHLVSVKIHSFRMRDDAARLTVGIMAGCDNITSSVTVTDKMTNEELGKSRVSIKECAAWGVASQVIKKYADGVVDFLSKR